MRRNSVIRTSPPRYYLTPTIEEMRDMAKRLEVGPFSPSFVADLANKAAGGTVHPPSVWADAARQFAERTLPAPDSDGQWKLEDGTYTSSRREALRAHTEKVLRYHNNICEFVDSIDFSQVPGYTPLEKAMNLLKQLKEDAQKGQKGDGDPLPILDEPQEGDGDGMVEDIDQAYDSVDNSDDQGELKEAQGKGTGKDSDLRAKAIDDNVLHESQLQVMLEIARVLDERTDFKVRRSRHFEPDPVGSDRRFRPIKNIRELRKLKTRDWVLYRKAPSLFWYRAVTGKLSVRERGNWVHKKQLMYWLIDASGSMGYGAKDKVSKAMGVMLNRLEAVMRGEAELWYRFFDDKVYEEHHVVTRADAIKAFDHIRKYNFSGGGTSIDSAMETARERIEELLKEGGRARPELGIITDGEDRVSTTKNEMGEVVLHAFLVGDTNEDLLKLASETGGLALEL